ncbi:MAG: rod shape-determining protein MreC [Burkholderiales bacterium PBB1]|nr:MAG: rod shape-determining protein MreC [Burkholderiales bacterium PBB1]
MLLGSIDRTPPPFFRQGLSALTKLALCSALAVFLMVADVRFKLTQPLRALLATALHPVQRALLAPVEGMESAFKYVAGLEAAIANESAARRALAGQALRVNQVEQLQAENVRLRALLDVRSGLQVRSQAAEVLYEATDPYSRKVVVDKGLAQGIAAGSPVISEAGVIGQVTRVYPLSSEVTLLTDKDAAVPVLNSRTQARSAAYGSTTGDALELRFMAGNADVQVGDVLQTSGVDGVYPPGLPVAKVVAIDRKVDSGFAKILLVPAALPDGVRHVLVLEPVGLQLPPRPESAAEAASSASAPASAASAGHSKKVTRR